MTPTPEALKAEIESGPYAAQVAPHWAYVHPAPDADPIEPPADDREAHGKWRETGRSNAVKRERAGLLHPDAVFELLRLLQARFVELGWTGVEEGLLNRARRLP